jgi:MoaA/NifB/PqqE/SkfB family radical SAM enzyme
MISRHWPGAPVNFFGGEPTERKDLPALIREMSILGQMSILSSNSVTVLQNPQYISTLANFGLNNWTISFDGMDREQCVDSSTWKRASIGLEVLKLARDRGISDLVANITVTKRNIDHLPKIIHKLTRWGIWSILCVLQVGRDNYEYSSGDVDELPSKKQIDSVFSRLIKMTCSGRYLIQTSKEWFEFILENGVQNQSWKCNDKASLTIDSDGSLKHCVDVAIPGSYVFDLETSQGRKAYLDKIKAPECSGCLWNSAFDSIYRSRTLLGEDESRRLYRHELTEREISKLLPSAAKWFRSR